MANTPSRSRSTLGCLLRAVVLLVLLAILGCAGSCAGLWTLFFAGIYGPPPPAERPLVIRNGTLWDGTGRAPRTGHLVLIEDGRIACAGPGCRVPAHAEVLDASGLFIAPGLIDLHLHFGVPAGPGMDDPLPLQIWSAMRHRPEVRRTLIETGITSVRSVGDDWDGLKNQRAWLADGTLGGPALFAAGPVFTAPGGHPAAGLAENAPWLIAGSTRQVTDPDRARTLVDELVDDGVDGIKLVYDGVGGQLPKLDREVMRAIVSQGRSRGVWVAVHTGTDADVREAVEAGATTIEHGARGALSDETIQAMVEAEVVLVPTLAVVEALLPALLPTARSNALRAHQAGVPLGVGSDTQGPQMDFGSSTLRELELLVEAGLSPQEALQAATGTAGRALGRPDRLGVIAEGAAADLVLYQGDPTQGLGALRQVELVIQGGRIAVDRRGSS